MSATEHVMLPLMIITYLMSAACFILSVMGGLLIFNKQALYVLIGKQFEEPGFDLPEGKRIYYNKLMVITLAVALACTIIFIVG